MRLSLFLKNDIKFCTAVKACLKSLKSTNLVRRIMKIKEYISTLCWHLSKVTGLNLKFTSWGVGLENSGKSYFGLIKVLFK